jgi:hypothetical protein
LKKNVYNPVMRIFIERPAFDLGAGFIPLSAQISFFCRAAHRGCRLKVGTVADSTRFAFLVRNEDLPLFERLRDLSLPTVVLAQVCGRG